MDSGLKLKIDFVQQLSYASFAPTAAEVFEGKIRERKKRMIKMTG